MVPAIIDAIDLLPRYKNSPEARTRPLSAIKLFVVHYDGEVVPAGGYNPMSRYKAQAQYHLRKNWNLAGDHPIHGFGLMYHYRISAEGEVYRTQPEELVTWHAYAANEMSLAICLDLGPGQDPPDTQLDALRATLDWLCERSDIPAGRGDVFGHGELTAYGNDTQCPGDALAWVQAYREANQPSRLGAGSGERFFPTAL